jgi:hypothetical protein
MVSQMSERSFRVVVSSVLVGALALAVIVVIAILLPRPPEPAPSSSIATGAAPSQTEMPLPSQSATPSPVFATVEVRGVGQVHRGSSSVGTLALAFTETSDAAIPDGPGSFWATLTDASGDGATVAFEGAPVFAGPDSLGATVELVALNVLQISIAASDIRNVESIRVTGLGISATSTAALGAIHLELSHFTGSLAGGATGNALTSPGEVIAGP